MKKQILLLTSMFVLASCGGGTSSSSQGGTTQDTSAQESSKAAETPTYKKASETYTFVNPTLFSDEDKAALPALGDHEMVAFCPVSTGHKYVYNWTRGVGGDKAFAPWPGTALAEKFNDKWWKVSYTDVDDLWIIFNGNGQTRDMHMDKPGYWWFWETDGDIHQDTPIAYYIERATFLDEKTVRIVGNENIESFTLFEGDKEVVTGTCDYNAVDISFNGHALDVDAKYTVKAKIGGKEFTKDVEASKIFESDAFNNKYAYEGNDLGVTYTKASSTFKVWSPISTKIDLRIYGTGTPASFEHGGTDTPEKTVSMTKGEKGVWTAKVDEDLNGKYYTYVVTNSTYTEKEIVDPYARSAGINGLRGMILDMETTNPKDWDKVTPHQYDRKALTVYESHIADLTSASNWGGTAENSKKFNGFHEANTSYTEGDVTVKTGFDHIKELGVNAVQILPMYDQANDEREGKFNWGYNPLNYNVVEGQYSSDPYDGAVRVKELKELVKDYHDAGINIIMDVVYNHVAGAVESNFDVLYPGYFYRYNFNGSLSNGSGCGNETASEHYMFSKFMQDSVAFWAKEYKLGGFRFDLMGLHDVDTMNKVTARAKTVNPGIVIYGEPWQGGTSTLPDSKSAKQINGNDYQGFGQFNDGLRDALIKGGLNPKTALGWATDIGNVHKNEIAPLTAGIKGFTLSDGDIQDPDKTVNYAAYHDNYTLHDRVAVNYPEGGRLASFIKPMAMLANAVVFTSQGTSFMLSGDEFLRAKIKEDGSYDENSYESSYKTNELDWSLKVKNLDHFEHYKKLIALKQNVDGLHLDKTGAAELKVEVLGDKMNAVTYEIKDTVNNKTYKIAHQACFDAKRDGDKYVVSNAPAIDFTGYNEIYLDTLDSNLALSSATKLGLGQTIIAVK